MNRHLVFASIFGKLAHPPQAFMRGWMSRAGRRRTATCSIF